MPFRTWAGADRSRAAHLLAGALLGPEQVESSRAVLLRGAWGTGVSWTLRTAAASVRARHLVQVVVPHGRRPVLADHLRDGADADVVLVVDDAHRLHDADADALRVALLNRPRRVLLGARSVLPLPEPLEWLAEAGVLTDLELGPIGHDEASALARARTGGPVHDGTVHQLRRLADGRSGFFVDLLDGGLRAGWISQRSGLWRQTGPIDLAPVARRVRSERRRMSPSQRAAHTLLGLAGGLPRATAEQVLGPEPLSELLMTGAVVRSDGRVRVAPLVAEWAIRREDGPLPAEAARRLLDAATPEVAAMELVEWRLAAGEEPTPGEVVAAARDRWAAADPHGALELVRRAPPGVGALRLEADLLAEVGRRQEAVAALERLERCSDGAVRDAAAAERATITMWLGQRDRALAISAAHLRRSGSPAAILDHALLALEGGDPATATALADRLKEDEPSQGAAISVMATAAALRGEGARSVALAREALERLGGADLAPDVARITLVLALGEHGDLEAAGEAAEEGYRSARDRGRSAQAWMALSRLRIALYRGDLRAAAAVGLEASELFADLDHHAALRWALAGRAMAAAGLGDPAAASALDAELVALGPSGVQFLEPDVLRAHGWAAVVAGQPSGAREAFERAADLALRSGSSALAATALHDLVRVGCATVAVGPLRELDGRLDSRWAGPRSAHASGVVDGDPARVLQAAEGFQRMGAALHAREAAAHAAAIAHATGDREVERRANSAMHRWPSCDGAVTPPLARGDHHVLTPREQEVAALAAGGATNRSVASQLGISVRTVENLLHRAYHKLGVRGRDELAARFAPAPPPR